MASKSERLRKAYEYKLGKDLVSKLSDDQIQGLSEYYNSLTPEQQSNVDSDIIKGGGEFMDTVRMMADPLNETMPGGHKLMSEEPSQNVSEGPLPSPDKKGVVSGGVSGEDEDIPEGLEDLLNDIKEEIKEEVKEEQEEQEEPVGALATINGAKFFGEDRYNDYVSELVESGTIDGEQLTPDERKEGFKARKNKIGFESFVNKVLKKREEAQKRAESEAEDTPTRVVATDRMLPGTAEIPDIKPPEEVKEEVKEEKKEQERDDDVEDINKKLDDLLGEIRKEGKAEEKAREKKRKQDEKKKRKEKENKLEGFKKFIVKPLTKAFKPVQNFLQKFFDAIIKVVLAKAFIKLIDWFSDPENSKKIDSIFRFVKDFWPAIAAGFLLVGAALAGFGVLALGKIAAVATLLIGLTASLAALAKALFGPGEKEKKAQKALEDDYEGDKDKMIADLEKEKEELNWFEKNVQGRGAEIDEQIDLLKTGKTKSYGFGDNESEEPNKEPQKMSGGGLVQLLSGGGLIGERGINNSSPKITYASSGGLIGGNNNITYASSGGLIGGNNNINNSNANTSSITYASSGGLIGNYFNSSPKITYASGGGLIGGNNNITYASSGGLIDALSFLPGTGTVMAPRASQGQYIDEGTTVQKFLGMTIPGSMRRSKYTPEDIQRYNRLDTGDPSRYLESYDALDTRSKIINEIYAKYGDTPTSKAVRSRNREVPDALVSPMKPMSEKERNDRFIGESFKNFGSNLEVIKTRNQKMIEQMAELGVKPDGYVNPFGAPVTADGKPIGNAFSGGGMSLGTDTVPAMLTPGEFVMSKGAVNKFGISTMMKMNKAGGGTNKPKVVRGQTYASGGGFVQPVPKGSYKGNAGQRYGDPRGYGPHAGIDITEDAPWGSDPKIPVVSMKDGTVVQNSPGYPYTTSGYTSNLTVDHGDGILATYLHTKPLKKVGSKVKKSETIGKMIDLGNQTHLHLQMYEKGKQINPLKFVKGAGKTDAIPPTPDASQIESVAAEAKSISSSSPSTRSMTARNLAPSRGSQTTTPSVVPIPTGGGQPSTTPTAGSDVPQLGSVDPQNNTLLIMKSMYNIV